jgi:hypothetical protein
MAIFVARNIVSLKTSRARSLVLSIKAKTSTRIQDYKSPYPKYGIFYYLVEEYY